MIPSLSLQSCSGWPFRRISPYILPMKTTPSGVDARSFLGLFALDYSKPLKVITDSLYAMRMLEIQQRNRAAHMAHA